MIRQKRAGKERNDNLYNERSKERLEKICAQKIRTTMIGALSELEKKFGFLWGLDEDGKDLDQELTEDEAYMEELFEQVRTYILDNGNKQIRNLGQELEQYTVTWNRYHIELPYVGDGNV